MFVIIAGGGRTGAQLATFLVKQEHKVRVIDDRREVLSRLHRELPTEVIYEGDPLDPKVLEHAGAREANVLAATTTSDEQNLVLCFIAHENFGIRRTIARVNDPRTAWLFNGKFHVDVALNQADILAKLIEEEMSLGDMVTLLKLRRGNYSLVEEKIGRGAPAIGLAVKDLKLHEHCVIAGIIRRGDVIVPRGVTILEEEDEVLAVTDSEGAKQLSELLSPPGNHNVNSHNSSTD